MGAYTCGGCGESKDAQFEHCLCDIRKRLGATKSGIIVTAEHEKAIMNTLTASFQTERVQIIPRNDEWNVLWHAPREVSEEMQPLRSLP